MDPVRITSQDPLLPCQSLIFRRIMTRLSLITANIPLLGPFLKGVQSGLIDSSMPKLSGSYQLSTFARSDRYRKQSSGTALGSSKSKKTRDSSRTFSTSGVSLTNHSGAPHTTFFDEPTENSKLSSDQRTSVWGLPDDYPRIKH